MLYVKYYSSCEVVCRVTYWLLVIVRTFDSVLYCSVVICYADLRHISLPRVWVCVLMVIMFFPAAPFHRPSLRVAFVHSAVIKRTIVRRTPYVTGLHSLWSIHQRFNVLPLDTKYITSLMLLSSNLMDSTVLGNSFLSVNLVELGRCFNTDPQVGLLVTKTTLSKQNSVVFSLVYPLSCLGPLSLWKFLFRNSVSKSKWHEYFCIIEHVPFC